MRATPSRGAARARRLALLLAAVAVLVGGVLRAQAAAEPAVLLESADEQAYASLAGSLARMGTYEQRYADAELEARCRARRAAGEPPASRRGILPTGGTAVAPPLERPRPDPRADPCAALLLNPPPSPPPDDLRWPPGAPSLFAAATLVASGGRPQDPPPAVASDLPAAYVAQAVVGTVTVALVGLLAALVAGPWAAALAAWSAALYPPWVDDTADLLSEPLGGMLVTLTALGLALGARGRPGPTGRGLLVAAATGAAAGALVLARADYVLLLPVAALALVACTLPARSPRTWGPALARGAVLLLAAVLVVAPWSRHASDRDGGFVPVTTGGGSALYVGTYLPGDGTTFGLKRDRAEAVRARRPTYESVRATKIPARAVLDLAADRHPELERDAALRREGLRNLRRYAVGRPAAFARMALGKQVRMWWRYSRGGFANVVSATTTAWHRTLVVLGAVGALLLLVGRGRRRLALLVALPIAYQTALHAIVVSQPRYAVPLMGLVTVLAAAALVEVGRRAIDRQRRRRGPAPAPRGHPPGPRPGARRGRAGPAPPPLLGPLAAVSEGRERAVCGEEPGFFCREVLGRTEDRTYAELADVLLGKSLTILLIVAVALVANRLLRRVAVHGLRRLGRRRGSGGALGAVRRLTPGALTETREISLRSEQRAEAVASILKSIVTVIVATVALFMVLGEIGVDLAPLIAGAGIVGVALGFGSQSLVKDFLTGIFILMEDQYGVGDTIVIDPQTTGVVEGVGLRSTRLRGIDGTVWHVPNGSIVIVGNQSQHWSRALVDVEVAYDTDVQHAKDVVLRVAERIRDEDPHVLEPPEMWGVQALGINGITLRLVVKTTPSEQFRINRLLNERVREAFAREGIEIPFPQQMIHYRDPAVAEVRGPSGEPLVGAPPASGAPPPPG